MRSMWPVLHEAGYAHTIEVWLDERLVGGLYGVALGQVFFGESMFSRTSDASKVAFAHLVRQLEAWDFGLIDCQVYSPHLASLGAEEIPRPVFIKHLDEMCETEQPRAWVFDPRLVNTTW